MSKLERITYVCLITVSLVSVGVLVRRNFFPVILNRSNQPTNASGLMGQKLDIPGTAWSSSQINAVVYLSSKCHFCEESMPFYRRLLAEHRANASTSIVAVTGEPPEGLTHFLASKQVVFDHVYQLNGPNPALPGTPSVLIVDKNGVILRAKLGKLSPSAEEELLKIVNTGKVEGVAGL